MAELELAIYCGNLCQVAFLIRQFKRDVGVKALSLPAKACRLCASLLSDTVPGVILPEKLNLQPGLTAFQMLIMSDIDDRPTERSDPMLALMECSYERYQYAKKRLSCAPLCTLICLSNVRLSNTLGNGAAKHFVRGGRFRYHFKRSN